MSDGKIPTPRSDAVEAEIARQSHVLPILVCMLGGGALLSVLFGDAIGAGVALFVLVLVAVLNVFYERKRRADALAADIAAYNASKPTAD